jgi:hypothetical protein
MLRIQSYCPYRSHSHPATIFLLTLLLLACTQEILLTDIKIVYILYSNIWHSLLLVVLLQNKFILIQF